MRIYVVGAFDRLKYIKRAGVYFPYALEPFLKIRELSGSRKREFDEFRRSLKSFMLDSGAFTFLRSGGKDVLVSKEQFDAYVEEYARYIADNEIDLYFEMDVDALLGIEAVEEYRRFLEKETKRKCIPVWHRSRGLDYWDYMIRNYSYVAIGGIAIRTFRIEKCYRALNAMCRKAHEKGVRVHGLGVGAISLYPKLLFDSIDTVLIARNGFGTSISVFPYPVRVDGYDQSMEEFLKRLAFVVGKFDKKEEEVDYAISA